MLIAAFLSLGLLSTVSAQFNPAVTVTCAVGPSYTFSLTGGSDTGVIFIDGQCAAQTTTAAAADYTFTSAECTVGTVPALGTEFKVVVQEYNQINLATDLIVKVTCNLDTASVTKVTSLEATGEDFDNTDTATVAPTFTLDFQNNGGTTITSGTVGDPVQIVISITAAEAAVFGFQVTTLAVAAGGDSVDVFTAGCSQFTSIIAQPALPSGGSLTLGFNLFIPKDTSASPSLPGATAATVTFTFTLEVCDGACTAPTCSKRRRRSADNGNTTYQDVELAGSLVVYPPGHKAATSPGLTDGQTIIVEGDDLCLSRTPIIGVLVGLSVALAVCLFLTICMFFKIRTSTKKSDMASFCNAGFKA